MEKIEKTYIKILTVVFLDGVIICVVNFFMLFSALVISKEE